MTSPGARTSRAGRWILGITLLLGLLAAIALAATGTPADRTFIGLSAPVQSLMSVTLPFTGVLLARDRSVRLGPKLSAAVVLAVGVAVYGIVVCAVAAAAAPGSAEDPWGRVATVALGSVLVQVVAQLVGTGFGLLVRSIVLACLATIVVPLGLWVVLTTVESLQPWLTPYGSAQNLFSGQMSPLAWAQWLTVFLLWGVGLNALGAARRQAPPAIGSGMLGP